MSKTATNPTLAKLERLFGGAGPAHKFLALALAEAIGSDRTEALLNAITPEGVDWTANVPTTRRPLAFFVGRTRYGLRALGFVPSQLEQIDQALAAAGLALDRGEILKSDEWAQGKSFGGIGYWNLLNLSPEEFEAVALRMPLAVARELRRLRSLLNKQNQLGADPGRDGY